MKLLENSDLISVEGGDYFLLKCFAGAALATGLAFTPGMQGVAWGVGLGTAAYCLAT